MRRRQWMVMVAALAAFAANAAPAWADTYNVNTTDDVATNCLGGSDPCSLREALSLAGDNSGSTVNVPPGTYKVDPNQGALPLQNNVTVVGAGARQTIIDGQQLGRVFLFIPNSPGETAKLSHLTVTNGVYNTNEGGDIRSLGALTLDHVHVTDGSSQAGGGGVANVSGTLTVDHSLIDANMAPNTGAGGGILDLGAPGEPAVLHIVNSTVANNRADGNGAGIDEHGDAHDVTTLHEATIADNYTFGTDGGGGVVVESGTVDIGGSILAGNTATVSSSPVQTNCTGVVPGNLTDDGSNVESGTDCHFTAGSHRQDADPQLGGLSNQGGETDVLPLGTGSPAIDLVPVAGCPATDQRDQARPQGPACDAGAFEAAAPAQGPGSKPPPAPHLHTLIGYVAYAPAFAVGVSPGTTVSPFDMPGPNPRPIVQLLAADGHVIVQQTLDPTQSVGSYALVDFDGLGACTGCSVVLRDARGVQDVQHLSFDGLDGQTSFGLFGSDRLGGILQGGINQPRSSIPPQALSVEVMVGHTVVADSRSLRPQCGGPGSSGVACRNDFDYAFRFSGLQPQRDPATVVLLQQAFTDGSPGQPPRVYGPRVPVDSATVRLDFALGNRILGMPALTALDAVPANTRGRTIYGSVYYTPPFAPGQNPGATRVPPGSQTIRLLNGTRSVGSTQVSATRARDGSAPFEIRNLPACARCTLELRDGPRVVDRAPVSLAATPTVSVLRRDLQFRDVTGNFLDGWVDAPNDVRPDRLRVVVRLADSSHRLVADSARLPQPCGPGAGSAHCLPGGGPYRLGGIPANTLVLVMLELNAGGWHPVDVKEVLTSPDFQDTSTPTLHLLRGVHAGDPGFQLIGAVGAGGLWAPQDGGPGLPRNQRLRISLLDPTNRELAHTTVETGAEPPYQIEYQLLGLKACTGCTLVMRNSRNQVEDAEPVNVGGVSPSVVEGPLLQLGEASDGAFIQGWLYAPKPWSPNDLIVRVLDPAGHQLTASNAPGVARASCAPAKAGCSPAQSFSYRLGHIRTASTTVTVVVINAATGRRLASTRATLQPTSDSWAAFLQLPAPPPAQRPPSFNLTTTGHP